MKWTIAFPLFITFAIGASGVGHRASDRSHGKARLMRQERAREDSRVGAPSRSPANTATSAKVSGPAGATAVVSATGETPGNHERLRQEIQDLPSAKLVSSAAETLPWDPSPEQPLNESVVTSGVGAAAVEIQSEASKAEAPPAAAAPAGAVAAAAAAPPAAGASTSAGPTSTAAPANGTAATATPAKGADGVGTLLIIFLVVTFVALLGAYCWWRKRAPAGILRDGRMSMRDNRRSYRREVSNTLAGDGKTESEGGTDKDVPSPGRKSYRDRRSQKPASGKVFGSGDDVKA